MSKEVKPIDVKTLGPLPPGIKQLTKEDLKFGPREKRLLKELFDWGEQSRKTHWILGEPYSYRDKPLNI